MMMENNKTQHEDPLGDGSDYGITPVVAGDILEKNHAHREGKTYNKLTVKLICPYHEAIIDENRIETALRNALGVPDLEVQTVEFRIDG